MDVDRLFAEFVAEDRAGGAADPRAYLQRASGPDREELSALLDGYLARAPRRAFDRAAFEASAAAPVAESLARSLAGSSGAWPALLPRLRARARLRREDVVARLAGELGVTGREDKVGRYYAAMERGTLPAAGVSDRVLEALGRIVGESAAALRAAGRAMSAPPEPEPLRARSAMAAAPAAAAPPERDEVDKLFTGGR